MKKVVLLFFITAVTFKLSAQSNKLLNVDWNLYMIHNTQANKKTFVDQTCHSTLYFNPDSTYRGRGCCNAVIPSFTNSDDVRVKSSRYELKENNQISMTKPSRKVKPCLSENTEELVFTSWEKVSHYNIKADTLILRCSNNTDLYYIKAKQ